MDKLKVQLNCITVTTDASYYHKEKAGGYAYIISYDQNRQSGAGMLKQTHPKSAQEAEIMCIAKAINKLLTLNLKAKLVVINTDCKNAIERILYPDLNSPYSHQICHALVKRMRAEMRCIVEFRHVKAHSGIQDRRSKANEWCDTKAKEYALQLRKILIAEGYEKRGPKPDPRSQIQAKECWR